MSYERFIGLRYLNGAHKNRGRVVNGGMIIGGLFITVFGVIWLAAVGGQSAPGAAMVVFGLLFSSVMFLLRQLAVFTAVSVLGVTFGVSALTVVLGVTSGFQKQFREKVLGVNAHVIIQKSEATFPDYREVMDIAANIDPDVIAVQPFVFGEMLVTRGTGSNSGHRRCLAGSSDLGCLGGRLAIGGDDQLLAWRNRVAFQAVELAQ